MVKEWLIDLEDRMMEITDAEQNKKRRKRKKRLKRNEESLRYVSGSIKHTNIQMIRVKETRENERVWENI